MHSLDEYLLECHAATSQMEMQLQLKTIVETRTLLYTLVASGVTRAFQRTMVSNSVTYQCAVSPIQSFVFQPL